MSVNISQTTRSHKYSSTLNTDAVCSYETSVNFSQTIRCHKYCSTLTVRSGQESMLLRTVQHYTKYRQPQIQWHPFILATSGTIPSRPTFADG